MPRFLAVVALTAINAARAAPIAPTNATTTTTVECGDKFQSCWASKCCMQTHAFGCFKVPDKQFAMCRPMASQGMPCVDGDNFLCPTTWLTPPAAPPPPRVVLQDEPPKSRAAPKATRPTAQDVKLALAHLGDRQPMPTQDKVASALNAASPMGAAHAIRGSGGQLVQTLQNAHAASKEILAGADHHILAASAKHGVPLVLIIVGVAIGAVALACGVMLAGLALVRSRSRRAFQAEMAILFEQERERRDAAERDRAVQQAAQLKAIVAPLPTVDIHLADGAPGVPAAGLPSPEKRWSHP